MNNLEIKGVSSGFDPLTVVQKIGDHVGEKVDTADIDACHWVRTQNSDVQNIIVRFVRRSKRNDILNKCRKKRVDTTVLGDETGKPIFVNEHLTQANKVLLSAAIKKKKENGWKFVWTAGGKILARKEEHGSAIQIASHADLALITA